MQVRHVYCHSTASLTSKLESVIMVSEENVTKWTVLTSPFIKELLHQLPEVGEVNGPFDSCPL